MPILQMYVFFYTVANIKSDNYTVDALKREYGVNVPIISDNDKRTK